MPKIIKNGKEYSGVPIEVVTAWAPTADPVQVKEPLMGNTDISDIGDGTVTGAIDTLKNGLTPVVLTGLTTSSTGAVSLGLPPSHYITTPVVTNIGDAYCIVFIYNGSYTIRVRSRLDDSAISNTSVNVKFLKV